MNDINPHPMKKVGDILKSARDKKGMAIIDAYKFIKVHPKYLGALEEGDYSVFSSEVHIKGFLKIYCKLLELNEDEVLAFFRREFDEKQLKRKKAIKPLDHYPVFITPAAVAGVATVLFILGFFSYLFYQYRTYSGAPALYIEKPDNNVTLSDTKLEVSGKTDRDSKVFLNGQRVESSPDGTFKVNIDLSEGVNKLSFLSVNKLGKETSEERSVIVRRDLSDVLSAQKKKVTLEVFAENGSTQLKAEVDGSETFNGTMLISTSRIFEASSSIKLSAVNSGVIRVKLNGVDTGIFGELGKAKEQVFK